MDGCAIFWKSSKFNLTENYSIEFNSCAFRYAAQHCHDDIEKSKMVNRLSKDNVAQILLFEPTINTLMMNNNNPSAARLRPSQYSFCVVNTHLYSNPKLGDVKLWQTWTLMRELEAFLSTRDLALFLCGDFNSEPTSLVYSLVASGKINPEHPDLKLVEGAGTLTDPKAICHSLQVVSAMATAFGAEPVFTNYTLGFKGTLDYMWLSPARTRVLAAMSVPSESTLLSTGEALPNAAFPSDHLYLCCDVLVLPVGYPAANGSDGVSVTGSNGNGNTSNGRGPNNSAVGGGSGKVYPSNQQGGGSTMSSPATGSVNGGGGIGVSSSGGSGKGSGKAIPRQHSQPGR